MLQTTKRPNHLNMTSETHIYTFSQSSQKDEQNDISHDHFEQTNILPKFKNLVTRGYRKNREFSKIKISSDLVYF